MTGTGRQETWVRKTAFRLTSAHSLYWRISSHLNFSLEIQFLPTSSVSQVLSHYPHRRDKSQYSHNSIKSGFKDDKVPMNFFTQWNNSSCSLYRDCMPTTITWAVRFLWHYLHGNLFFSQGMEYCCYRAVRWNLLIGSSSGVRTLPQAFFRIITSRSQERGQYICWGESKMTKGTLAISQGLCSWIGQQTGKAS